MVVFAGLRNFIIIFVCRNLDKDMSTDILRIIEGGLFNDKRKIINYSTRLAERLRSEGDAQLADCILEQINANSNKSAATADAMRMIPLDADSKLQIVEVIPETTTRTQIVLSDTVKKQIDDLINLISHHEEIERAGIEIKASLLLYGPPGCGKTSIAHYISEQTGLPLVVAKLDGIVSSLLGSTAKNLRKIFSYASSLPCILFLDEFDAIAKARDDNHELGELKRVINSLLQNIDSMPSTTVLIAATNHPQLLDKAVWRRFTVKSEVNLPDDSNRITLIKLLLDGYNCPFLDDRNKLDIFSSLVSAMSPSDISTLMSRVKVNSIISGSKDISFEDLIQAVYNYQGKDESMDKRILFYSANGITQASISKMLNISVRQVRNILSDNR
jgi:SpoVK/Ycf46/Vps4 family AAA+-type ATPase